MADLQVNNTLLLISVRFHGNIYSSSLRLFEIDSVVSLLPATRQQCFILLLPLPLRWFRVLEYHRYYYFYYLHINSLHPIKFTLEMQKEDKTIPFLDLLL